MQTRLQDTVKSVKWGLALALLAIFLGFALGGAFGLAEETLKSGLKANAAAVFETAYHGDAELMKKKVDKAWVYYQRAHLHWAALGTAALAQILLMALLNISGLLKTIISTMLGVGAVGYGGLLAMGRSTGSGSGGHRACLRRGFAC